ncbi:hypothetical protein AAGS61_12785 [Lysinibacillus sp. KU-BSD001]|uniref:hypothetical protein n=1 Tax=Lysinibacillus sp. KU-BSD001 TaxID=3141328 RepID=UPI0036E858FE
MKRAIFFVLFSVFLVACNSSMNNVRQVPEGKMIIDDQEYIMESYRYNWKEKNTEMKHIRANTIEELAEELQNISVAKNSKLKFSFEKKPLSISVYQHDQEKKLTTVDVKENELTLPADEGYYMYEVTAEWQQGVITFIFDVEVK